MASIAHIRRLHTTLAALAPIDGVSVPTLGSSANARVDFTPAATQPQKNAVASALAAFDWSDAAQSTWEDDQNLDRTALINGAIAAVQDNNTYLGVASPSNAQNLAQIRALTQQMNKVIKRLAQL